uniref:Ig-like domain-containing protein n=1 Tax=Astyanax mexicanus TaxID=7994 RepID=A0A3B1JKE4_ASTMX
PGLGLKNTGLVVGSKTGVKCESMESLQTAVQKKPGETLSLSCRGSGFNFREYNMHWIRQQTGKPMEWMWRQNVLTNE